ncbi:hypothetical protein [Streptomyces roseolus]|uniref:hypothetical protein n=1 Tax=Streptomyces roseolus TaxID=67358 RepID=UPI00365D82F6
MTESHPAHAGAIPSTIWACGPTDLPDPSDPWPLAVLNRAIIELSAPAAQVLLLSATRTQQLAGRWSCSQLADTGREISAIAVADSPARPGRGEADLVIASLLRVHGSPYPADIHTRLALTASDYLRGDGVLAVLTRCAHSATGILDDATGSVVAAAQAADLLYLSHLVAAPVHDDTVAAPKLEPGHRHEVVHTDVTVFIRPDDQHHAAVIADAA